MKFLNLGISRVLNIAFQSQSIVRIKYFFNKRVKELEGQIMDRLSNEQEIKVKTVVIEHKLQLKNLMKPK